jgi:sugar/nucleoside kinase (ribokinase family)
VTFLAAGNLTIDDVVSADGAVAVGQSGGNGLYAALGMWIWDVPTALLAGAGTDFPQEWLDRVAAAGIDLSGLWHTGEPHALRSRAFYRADGSRTDRVAEADLPAHVAAALDLSTDLSAFDSAEHRRIWPAYSPSVQRLPAGPLDGAHAAPGPNRQVADLVEALAGQAGVVTLDWPWWDEAAAALPHVSAVLPGIEELVLHAGDADPYALARGLGPTVVVKQGAAGCLVLREDRRPVRVGVVPIRPVDPTGAGDAFCGGFCVGLAATGDPVRAAGYGAVSASFIVERADALSVLDADRSLAAARLAHVLDTTVEVTPA